MRRLTNLALIRLDLNNLTAFEKYTPHRRYSGKLASDPPGYKECGGG
jgi:hypothetical protein